MEVEHLENGEDRLERGEWLLNWVPHPQAIIYISNRLSEHWVLALVNIGLEGGLDVEEFDHIFNTEAKISGGGIVWSFGKHSNNIKEFGESTKEGLTNV